MIDFEQLKIENQTYSEKIEERNDVSLGVRAGHVTMTIISALGGSAGLNQSGCYKACEPVSFDHLHINLIRLKS